MAEKKFFVDINLQGSALTNAKIGTNSGIGSTEGAFGYDSSAHRLQYFDGTATKEVANLSDIAAVTGGLIFQSGYDPTTDTPDIRDGNAKKGFFWVVTTSAGTFDGQSVQVGDSLVATVDGAAYAPGDWLILQGNIVIATDSVDGISRLATQTEANAGTEGGAVVITPATLQGKIDAQITPEISSKLPLAGGTMSGNIMMDGNYIAQASIVGSEEIQTDKLSVNIGANIELLNDLNAKNSAKIVNLPAPTSNGDAANKLYVDDQDALKVSKAGDTMSGDLNLGSNNLTQVGFIDTGSIQTDELNPLNNQNILLGGSIDAQNARTILNLPVPGAGGDAANKDYVDNNTSNKLPLAGGSMTGGIDMGGNDINNLNAVRTQEVSNLDGTVGLIWDDGNANFININQLKGLADAPTDGTDATNKTYVDGQDALKLSLTGGTMSGNIDMGLNQLTNIDGLTADYTFTNYLANSTNAGDVIKLNSSLDGQGQKSIINLPAPTNGGDATNKTYVDGAAATAESNANAYTDTEIAATSFGATITTSDWNGTALDGYYFTINHALNSSYLTYSLFDVANNQYVEADVQQVGLNSSQINVNNLPTNDLIVSFVKSGGNL